MAASDRNPDFLKIELCRHGWTCRHRQAGDCSYAHVLHELRPPNESCRPYPGVWRDGVDRFYGQRMGREQIERIKTYYNEAPRCDRPMWSHALYWYVSERGSFDDYPYDFGLEQDWKSVCMFRVPSKQAFEWAPHLWDRIEQRRIRLTTPVYRAPPTQPQTMYGQSNPDLRCCVLCPYGAKCRFHAERRCGFAHALKNLRRQYAQNHAYDEVWHGGVDRWYGQEMTSEVLERIARYANTTHQCDIPMWTEGVRWYQSRKDGQVYDLFPSDFGLAQDLEVICMNRVGGALPFESAPGLWARISLRRKDMLQRSCIPQVWLRIPRRPFLAVSADDNNYEGRLATDASRSPRRKLTSYAPSLAHTSVGTPSPKHVPVSDEKMNSEETFETGDLPMPTGAPTVYVPLSRD